MNLFSHQQAGVDWLTKPGRRHAGLADEPGLGKTITAIRAAVRLQLPVVVVAPAIVAANWIAEWTRWGVGPAQRITTGADTVDHHARCVVVSHALAAKKAMRDALAVHMTSTACVLIVDEAHMLANPETLRAKAVWGTGKHDGLMSWASRVWVLTGTPMPNSPRDLWLVLRALWPERTVNPRSKKTMTHDEWTRHFCVTSQATYGLRVHSLRTDRVPELRQRLAGLWLRRKKDECLDLPPVFWEQREVVAATVADAQFDSDVTTRCLQAVRGVAPDTAIAALLGMTQLAQYLHLVGLAKVPHIVEMVGHDLECGTDCVVIFARHLEVVARLCDGLKRFAAVTLTGSDSQQERADKVAAFQRGQGRVLVCQIDAAGVGITLTRCALCIFAELSWVPATNSQAADRVHRIGQSRAVRIRVVSAPGADGVVMQVLRRKSQMIQAIVPTLQC